MSEFRRRLIAQVASDSDALPAGCVRCEYLENNGTQWIDTGRRVKKSENIYIDAEFSSYNYGAYNFGWINGDDADRRLCIQQYSTASWLYVGCDPTFSGDNLIFKTRFAIQINNTSKTVYINDKKGFKKYDFDKPFDDGVAPCSAFLFSCNNNGSVTSTGSAKIYEYALINEDGNYTQHLIPILDPNGTPCFYDTVSKKFHYNQGTGTFLYKITEQ